MDRTRGLFIAAPFLLLFVVASAQDKQRQEEADKYYEKWLGQDVLYIITEEERAVFKQLTTADEKDQFIEQFWTRRDPDLRTAANEYREEHYRRLAYCNERFGSGIPGWKADRGKIYISFGPPDEIEYNAGGNYVRKPYEGGGRTTTYPFEVWFYRYLPGVGEDIEIEFVDRSLTGEFRMAVYPWEKDILLNVDGEGETLAERFGLANRAYRPGLHPGMMNNTQFLKESMGMRKKDEPFERQLQFFKLQRPPQIKQSELQEIVELRVNYAVLPISVFINYVWVDQDNALVPITIEVPNKELDYVDQGKEFKARVGIYGRVTSMKGRLESEFEEVLSSRYLPQHVEVGRTQKSVFQKIVALPPGRHKVELVVKDIESGKISTSANAVHIPGLKEQTLTASPVVLAQQLESLDDLPDTPSTFVIGNVRVVPNVTRKFKSTEELGVYFQVLNTAVDSSTMVPSVQIEYIINRGGKEQLRVTDSKGSSITYASSDRVVLLRKLKLVDLTEGNYELVIRFDDLLSGQSTAGRARFEIVG